jgi:hypothetical protein
MKTNTATKALLISIALASASMVSADVLAQYDFNSAGDPYADVANASDLTADDITPGTQLATDDGRSTSTTTEGAGSFFAKHGALSTGTGTTSAAWTAAQDNGIYVEFTLTPDAGKSLNFTDLHLDVGYQGENNFRLAVTSSLTGYDYGNQLTITTENATDKNSLPNILESNLGGISTTPAGIGADWGAGEDTIIDLSGIEFDNITSSVTFRIYGFKLNNGDGSDILRLDNIYVNGSASPVPEPSSFALLAGGLAFASIMLKRRR